MSRKPYNISQEERAARSARMRARVADPAFQENRRRHGKAHWTEAERALQAVRMRALHADPAFRQAQRQGRETVVRSALDIPHNTMPVIRGLFVEMNAQLATLGDVSTRSGVAYDTIRAWRQRSPHVDLLEATLNTLDLELAIVPIGTRDDNGFVRKKIVRKKTGRGAAR